MIRPLYRWKSFWLGIFILISLGWAWVWSSDRLSAVQVDTPLYWGVIAQYNGEAGLFYGVAQAAMWNFLPSDDIMPQDFERGWRKLASDSGIIVLHHWLLAFLFLLPWTAFLAWRWRRLRRISVH